MLQITPQFKQEVISTLLNARANFSGSDAVFAKQWSMNTSVYSRLKNGETEGLLRETQWLNLGRELDISLNERKWNAARTDVFIIIEQDIDFCQKHSKAKICVDDCGIGKTFTAKYLSRNRKNCFYVDASQAKTAQLFIRLIAKTIGIDQNGKYADVKANIKYYLKMLPQPLVVIDEAGDLHYQALLELKELWNATENACGWYMIGAEGLRSKIDKGIRSKVVGYREIFSRYSERYTTTVPTDRHERISFYKKLIYDVLSVNMDDKGGINQILSRCLTQDANGQIGGLRRAESLLILSLNND